MIWMDVDTALSEVPVNSVPLTDDTDFKTVETAVAYNAAGMALYWHFVTPDGAYTVTAVTPTTGGDYDWAHQQQGMYTIEMPASGGASINNDTEGHGWFTGFATGVLPWRGPTIGFRAAGLNDKLIQSAYDTNRGLAGLALPAAAANAAGGLVISISGGLNADSMANAVTGIYYSTVAALASVNDAAASTTSFKTTLSEADNFWNDAILTFTSGALSGQSRVISTFANTNGVITLDEALTSAPANGVTFQIKASHTHTKSQIAAAVLDLDASTHTTNSTLGAIINDWEDGGRLDLITDSILADTNELQTDDYPARFTSIEGATFNTATDSLEALRDQGDTAWVTATGFSTHSAADVANVLDPDSRFRKAVKGITLVTVGSASTITSVVTSSMDPAASVTDQFKGKILTFAEDTTTAALRGQSTDITASTSGGVLTVTALTTAPVSGDVATIA